MLKMNYLSYRDYNHYIRTINNDLQILAITLFVLFYSVLKSIIPFRISVIILATSIILLLFRNFVINNKGIFITKIDVMWLIFLLFFTMNILFNNLINKQNIYDIVVYTSAILFLLMVKSDIDKYKYSFIIIKVLGIFYAISAIFHYLFTDLYLNNILPLFETFEQDSILWSFYRGSYSGITTQTAHLAGYSLSAIAVIIFSNWNVKFPKKFFSITLLIILFLGLILSAKRAHFIFMIVAMLITLFVSLNYKKSLKKIIKFISGTLVIILLLISLYNVINFSEDSPIVNFVNEWERTFSDLLKGKDVTSGRVVLYKHALEMFKDKPVFGIGWKEFKSNSLGLIRNDVESHPHNIYIQLLTELGIIGFSLFMFPVLYLYYKSFKLLRLILKDNGLFKKWELGLKFSFFSQTFFLLYGMTGNLIIDYNFLLWYFFASSISLSALFMTKQTKIIRVVNKSFIRHVKREIL